MPTDCRLCFIIWEWSIEKKLKTETGNLYIPLRSSYTMKKTLDNILKFGKKVIKPIAKPLFLSTALFLGGTALNKAYSQQYQAKNPDKINIFVQPNDSTLAYYGSGDVNQDNQLNWNDYNKMVSEAPQIDEADLNGNGIPSDQQDIQIAEDYFNGNIEYLPSQWNKLETREERIGWLDDMLAIDQTDTITYVPYDYTTGEGWISGNYAGQTSLNFNGFKFKSQEEKEIMSAKYDTTNIGRFNIPVYAGAVNGHGRGGVVVQDSVKNPFHWVYPDQQNYGPLNDLRILGENFNPPANSQITIDRLTKAFENNDESVGINIEHLVNFRSGDDKILNLYYYNPKVIETREQALDKTYPILNLQGIENNLIYNPNYTTISINVSDQYFDRAGYSLNNLDTTWFSTPDTSIYLNSQLGNNELLVIAEDKAGNQTLEKRTYITDSNVATEDEKSKPQNYSLGDNYPNPFNPSTTISYTLPKDENVKLNIFNIKGQKLETLVNEKQVQGEHKVIWDSGKYPAGIYLYQLQTPNSTQTKKMLHLK